MSEVESSETSVDAAVSADSQVAVQTPASVPAEVSDKASSAETPQVVSASPEKSAADDKSVDPKAKKEGYWPADWLTKVSKGDEKISKQLGRYASPEALAEALIAAQSKIRSGELKPVLPKNAKPEEVSQWRKDNGIPETPEKYDLKFDSGLVIGQDDQTRIGEFLKTAHEHNLTPDQAKAAIEWSYKNQESQIEARYQLDADERQSTQDALNKEWGGAYRQNINLVSGLLDMFPESIRDNLKSSRMADGTALFNNPDVVKGFVALALEVNPAGTLVPANNDPMKGVEDEISVIEKTMREHRNQYNKDEKMQARYRDLLVAREKLQKRAA